jgi:hypothetical protein
MPSIVVDIKSELPTAIKWTNEHTRQLPFSISQALNATAQGSKFIPGSQRKSVLKASQSILASKLDRPKPATQKGLRATVASKRNLQVVILPKDRPYPMNKYIQGNLQGGNRPVKVWERTLQSAARNTFPSNMRLVPTENLSGFVDRFGNIPKPVIQSITSGMSTKYQGGGANYFAGKPRGGNRPYGIYRRYAANKRLQAVFVGMSSLSYDSKLSVLVPQLERKAQQNFGVYLRHFLSRNVANQVRMGRADLRTGLLV